MKPNFDFCLITKNEAQTLPRLLKSLEEFKARKGIVNICDTGSTDDTVQIAKDWGCNILEAGTKFLHTINKELADKINDKFVVFDCHCKNELMGGGKMGCDNGPDCKWEADIVKEGDKYFDFASARNEAANMASNDWVSFVDADEVLTILDIDKLEATIKDKPNLANIEYSFIFSHDQYGNPATEFTQSKMYDRTKLSWTGLVHECLTGVGGERQFIGHDIFKLEHWQIPGDRHSYLKGLAVDCFNKPENDRNSHYFARELFWSGRLKSAIKEFENHIAMNRWPAERAESAVFIGDAYGKLGQPEKQVEYYSKAIMLDSGKRNGYLRLARFYQSTKNWQAALCYSTAAMQIPWNGFYASDKSEYEHVPYEIAYQACGWLGRIKEAQEYINKALWYQPGNPNYIRDTQYYFEFPIPNVDGWMNLTELQYLYNMAKENNKILELGSWKGRSTCALATACKGTVTCVDTWEGSADPIDSTNWMAKREDVFEVFKNNTKQFKNIIAVQKRGDDAAKDYEDGSFDAIFIDAGHSYLECKSDIEAWLPKVKKGGILCGHDYLESWMGVIQAVTEAFGKPDELHSSIWVHYVK